MSAPVKAVKKDEKVKKNQVKKSDEDSQMVRKLKGKFVPSPSNEELKNPMNLVIDFFENFDVDEARSTLRDCVVEALTKNISMYDNGKNRSNLLFFTEKIMGLIEGNAILIGKHPSFKGTGNAIKYAAQIKRLIEDEEVRKTPSRKTAVKKVVKKGT